MYPTESNLSDNFILKRTASHGIELLGILAFHASPVWVLAALADATGGGRRLIAEISDELQKEGLIEERFETVEGLLDGLERTSDHLAVTLNMPPVDIPGLPRNSHRGHRSTFEAIAQALGLLEGPETEARLLDFFHRVLDRKHRQRI